MRKPRLMISAAATALLASFVTACAPAAGGDADAKTLPAALPPHLIELTVVQTQTLRSSAERTGSRRWKPACAWPTRWKSGRQAGQRVVQRGFLGLSDGQVVRPVSATARERAGGA